MKKLSIIVRSEKLDDVKAILDECGSTGATVSNIMGYGNQKGRIRSTMKMLSRLAIIYPAKMTMKTE